MGRFNPTVHPIAAPSPFVAALHAGFDTYLQERERKRLAKTADEQAEQARRRDEREGLESKARLYLLGLRTEEDLGPSNEFARQLVGAPITPEAAIPFSPPSTTDWAAALRGGGTPPAPTQQAPVIQQAAPTGLSGIRFDPATGAFGSRPPNPAALMIGQAAKQSLQRLAPGVYLDPSQTPEARAARIRSEQTAEAEKLRTQRETASEVAKQRRAYNTYKALYPADPFSAVPFDENDPADFVAALAHKRDLEKASVTRQGNEPSLAELLQKRITEIRTADPQISLEKASAQARLEFGQAPPSSSTPVVQVQNPDGTVTYVRQSEAPGQAAPQRSAMGSAALKKALATNEAQFQNIDDAIAEIEKYPAALGTKRGLGDFIPPAGNIADKVNQMLDPKGVEARAALANISSLVIHDRSGAAVTVSEFPRLAPFVPRISDDKETAIKKLKKLKRAIQAESDALEEQLGVGAPPSRGTSPAKPEGDSSTGEIDLTIPATKAAALTEDQRDWDEAVKKYGKAVVLQKYGPRPE